MVNLKLNLFEINSKHIPDIAYKYRVSELSEAERAKNRYQNFWNYGGVSTDYHDKSVFSSLIENSENTIKLIDSYALGSLPERDQEKLIQSYLVKEFFLENILRTAFVKVRERQMVNNYAIDTYPETEVKKIGSKFYLILNFRHKIYMNQNLWSYCKKDTGTLNNQIGQKICFLQNRKRTYEIKSIHPPAKEIIDGIINYAIDRKFISSKENLEKIIGKIDYDQPVFYCKDFDHAFIPQLSALTFNFEDIEGTDEAKEISKYWKLTNSEKENIINDALNYLKNKQSKLGQVISNTPFSIKFKKYDYPELLAKNYKGEAVPIKSTKTIFHWLKHEKPDINNILLPFDIPASLKGINLPLFILMEESLSKEPKDKLNGILADYQKINKHCPDLPKMILPDNQENIIYFSEKNVTKVINQVKEVFKSTGANMGFAIIVSKSKNKEDKVYEILKRRLFNSKILSQNLIWKNLKNDKGFMSNNLLLQIFTKMGVRYFAVGQKLEYDYILGLDTGSGEYGKHRVGGCTVVFDSQGKLNRIQPIDAAAPGETINIPRVFEYLSDKTDLNLSGKKILVLRDGILQSQEREDLKKLSLEYETEITVINIKKKHKFKIFSDTESRIGTIISDMALLMPHKSNESGYSKYGANPLKIDCKFIFSQGNSIETVINSDDLNLLYNLTHLNYSTLYKEMRLPAPIHYADKFVKALAKGWKVDTALLNEGALYFI